MWEGQAPGGGTPYVMGDTYVPRFWPPFFTLAGSSTIFLGYFSHPPTAKLSFGVQKLPIFTKIDLFGPKFNFFLDLFGSNFQRPAAHPHQFSGRVPASGAQKSVPDSAGEWPTFSPPPLESCSGTANVDGPNCCIIKFSVGCSYLCVS